MGCQAAGAHQIEESGAPGLFEGLVYPGTSPFTCGPAHVVACLSIHLQVGEALHQVLSEGVVSRSELHITSKLW